MTMTNQESVSTAPAATVVPSFLAELTRAMQAAAEQSREHIAAVVADDAAAEVEKARNRAAVEAEELRRLAEEDVGGIQAWANDETKRIRQEASRRTDERRKELETHLAKHESIISTEIDGVDVAVGDYYATLDQFFDQLREATDPAEIARHAGSLPAPPDLESVRAAARADAVATLANTPEEPVSVEPEPGKDAPTPSPDAEVGDEGTQPGAGLGVMDPEASPGLGVMDPEAAGRSEDLEPAAEGAVAASAHRPNPAVRLLHTIAPWTAAGHEEDDRGAHGT